MILLSLQAQIESTSDRVQYNDLQSHLCATLQVCPITCSPYTNTDQNLILQGSYTALKRFFWREKKYKTLRMS